MKSVVCMHHYSVRLTAILAGIAAHAQGPCKSSPSVPTLRGTLRTPYTYAMSCAVTMRARRLFAVIVLAALAPVALAQQRGAQEAIAAAHPVATAAGLSILDQGGNAFDAAVAVSATLAVVEPYSSGLGGGGFWLLYRARDSRYVMVDGREVAPRRARAWMYQDERGEIIPGRSIDGVLAAGIPGQPAALVHLAERYGRLPLATSLAPAIRAARDGFEVGPAYQRVARFRSGVLRASMPAAAVFLKNGEVPPLGHRIIQVELARTLERLALGGHAGFYAGPLAKQLVGGVRAAGGIWSLEDLRDYRVIEREPVVGTFRGTRIISAPPPSSGGVALLTMLNILDGYPQAGFSSLTGKHLLVEAMRRAYRDRAEFLGDPDFVTVPIQWLTSSAHAAALRKSIRLHAATPSADLPAATMAESGRHTTHFSIQDREGNRVAATLSINYPFGSGFVPPDTGVLLNDEMDDFASKPGAPNVYGLIGAQANAIAPGKRMLSSMSPTFVETQNRVAILGTPGGSRIITMVLHGILGVMDGKSAEEIVRAPRFHHQYLPDVVQFEPGALSDGEQSGLARIGHLLKPLDERYGNMQAVIFDRKAGVLEAASDPRGEGQAIVR
jgi:gamma-glutamyltranspeptidase/glutathione hydrolase